MKDREIIHGEIIHGLKVVWGMKMECPPLPQGFKLIRRLNETATAVSARRKRYLIFLNPDRLVPILRSKDLKGRTRADFANQVLFSAL